MSSQPECSAPFSVSPGREAITILVAEDPFVSSFLRAMLKRRGHEVVTALPAHASEMMAKGLTQAQLVITNSPELFLAFADRLPLLYIAANPDPALAGQFPTCRTLRKPFRNSELLEAVDELAHSALS